MSTVETIRYCIRIKKSSYKVIINSVVKNKSIVLQQSFYSNLVPFEYKELNAQPGDKLNRLVDLQKF